jgi:hypothetical protein
MAPHCELTLAPGRTPTLDEFASLLPEASEAALRSAVKAVAEEEGEQELGEPLQVVFTVTGIYLCDLGPDASGDDALDHDLPWLPELVMAFARDGCIEELVRWSRLTLASRRKSGDDVVSHAFLDKTITDLDRFFDRPAKAVLSTHGRPRRGRAPRRQRRTQRARARSPGSSSSDDPDPEPLARLPEGRWAA